LNVCYHPADHGPAGALRRISVTDTQIKDRVNGALNGSAHDGRTTEHPLVAPVSPAPATPPDQALHVLAMAQRTADEHVGSAQRHAEGIRADARAAAEKIAQQAEQHAQTVRREAEKVVADARAAAEQAGREAQAQVDAARRNAEKIIADARAEATTITAGARGSAEELESAAKRRYDEIVGSLAAKRASLQGQIEALEQFDQQYRARLLTFMQSQIRALWADNPTVDGELAQEDDA
jgi:vacuolar-type H+-ATPase subunit H